MCFKIKIHVFSAVTEITIKTGSDGTDSNIGAKICDGAGEAKRNRGNTFIMFEFKVRAAKPTPWIIVALMTLKSGKLTPSRGNNSWETALR